MFDAISFEATESSKLYLGNSIIVQNFPQRFWENTDFFCCCLGNLSWALRESDLRNELGRFGEITYLRVMTDRETGRSRGFGFVEVKLL